MSDESKFIMALGAWVVGIIVGVVGLTMWNSSASCHSQASRMGYPATWGPLQDCMIEVAPDRWVPGSSYRYWPNGDQQP